jgi:hypothetical protein
VDLPKQGTKFALSVDDSLSWTKRYKLQMTLRLSLFSEKKRGLWSDVNFEIITGIRTENKAVLFSVTDF